MPSLVLADLDQRPELRPAAAALFGACPPGHEHQVCGIPERMGMAPEPEDLKECLGVLLALSGIRLVGALALCPYSAQQVTLWGPAVTERANAKPIVAKLMREARVALRSAGYESMRCLVDVRNRAARALLQSHGFSAWKDNHLYERELLRLASSEVPGFRAASKVDHPAVARILVESFPEGDHCQPGLARREADGFRHYLLEERDRIVAAAAVDGHGRRTWLKMIAVERQSRGRKLSRKLLSGILAAEAKLQVRSIGLEVLADNAAANALYAHCGFDRRWTATIMTGPL